MNQEMICLLTKAEIKFELQDNELLLFTFNPSQTVQISGDVDYDLLEGTEIEVEQLQIVNQ